MAGRSSTRADIFFPNLFTIVFNLIKHAANSGTSIDSNMISMPSFPILSLPESLNRQANVLLIRRLPNFWKSLLISSMTSTGHLMFWEMSAILSSRKPIKTAISLGNAAIRSSITTVQTTILRLNRKTAIKNTAKAKNTAQIPSFRWGCPWMETASPLHFHFFLEMLMNRLP